MICPVYCLKLFVLILLKIGNLSVQKTKNARIGVWKFNFPPFDRPTDRRALREVILPKKRRAVVVAGLLGGGPV